MKPLAMRRRLEAVPGSEVRAAAVEVVADALRRGALPPEAAEELVADGNGVAFAALGRVFGPEGGSPE